MTKAKSAQARSVKRNARAKAKKLSANKARATPTKAYGRSLRAALNGDRLQFDEVMGDLVSDINTRKHVQSDISSVQDVLAGMKKMTADVFKLFTYATLVDAMITNGVLDEYELAVDLKGTALELINIDKRVQTMIVLAQQGEEDALYTEAMDISTTLSNHTQELYAEVVRSEKHALTIESTLDHLANELTEIDSPEQRRNEVMSTLAYQYLDRVNKEAQETAPETPASDAAA